MNESPLAITADMKTLAQDQGYSDKEIKNKWGTARMVARKQEFVPDDGKKYVDAVVRAFKRLIHKGKKAIRFRTTEGVDPVDIMKSLHEADFLKAFGKITSKKPEKPAEPSRDPTDNSYWNKVKQEKWWKKMLGERTQEIGAVISREIERSVWDGKFKGVNGVVAPTDLQWSAYIKRMRGVGSTPKDVARAESLYKKAFKALPNSFITKMIGLSINQANAIKNIKKTYQRAKGFEAVGLGLEGGAFVLKAKGALLLAAERGQI